MPKLARACAVVVAVATSLAGGIAAAQIQSGVARKTAAFSIALGVPAAAAAANANAKTDVATRTPLGQARLDIVDWIEGWYNRQRLHSANGFLPPVTWENTRLAA